MTTTTTATTYIQSFATQYPNLGTASTNPLPVATVTLATMPSSILCYDWATGAYPTIVNNPGSSGGATITIPMMNLQTTLGDDSGASLAKALNTYVITQTSFDGTYNIYQTNPSSSDNGAIAQLNCAANVFSATQGSLPPSCGITPSPLWSLQALGSSSAPSFVTVAQVGIGVTLTPNTQYNINCAVGTAGTVINPPTQTTTGTITITQTQGNWAAATVGSLEALVNNVMIGGTQSLPAIAASLGTGVTALNCGTFQFTATPSTNPTLPECTTILLPASLLNNIQDLTSTSTVATVLIGDSNSPYQYNINFAVGTAAGTVINPPPSGAPVTPGTITITQTQGDWAAATTASLNTLIAGVMIGGAAFSPIIAPSGAIGAIPLDCSGILFNDIPPNSPAGCSIVTLPDSILTTVNALSLAEGSAQVAQVATALINGGIYGGTYNINFAVGAAAETVINLPTPGTPGTTGTITITQTQGDCASATTGSLAALVNGVMIGGTQSLPAIVTSPATGTALDCGTVNFSTIPTGSYPSCGTVTLSPSILASVQTLPSGSLTVATVLIESTSYNVNFAVGANAGTAINPPPSGATGTPGTITITQPQTYWATATAPSLTSMINTYSITGIGSGNYGISQQSATQDGGMQLNCAQALFNSATPGNCPITPTIIWNVQALGSTGGGTVSVVPVATVAIGATPVTYTINCAQGTTAGAVINQATSTVPPTPPTITITESSWSGVSSSNLANILNGFYVTNNGGSWQIAPGAANAFGTLQLSCVATSFNNYAGQLPTCTAVTLTFEERAGNIMEQYVIQGSGEIAANEIGNLLFDAL